MTEGTDRDRNGGGEPALREIIRTHKGAYHRMYRKRWGKEPPGRNLPRVALVQDPFPEGEENALRAMLFADGAAVEDWRGVEGSFHALLVAASDLEVDEELERFRRFLRRAIARSTMIAGLGSGVLLLAREGFLGGRRVSGAPEHREFLASHDVFWTDASVVRDGPFLTCRDPDQAGDFVGELMEMIRNSREEEE